MPAASDPDSAALTSELASFARAWASAWSEKRTDDYLGFYATAFRPADGSSRGAWEADRRSRLGQAGGIEVKLSGFEAEPVGTDRARLSFDQSYRSATYSDVVHKTFELVREDGAWKIRTETSDG